MAYLQIKQLHVCTEFALNITNCFGILEIQDLKACVQGSFYVAPARIEFLQNRSMKFLTWDYSEETSCIESSWPVETPWVSCEGTHGHC